MENKYYDTIVTLIKENEKFAGLEQILDDIIQDVYEHSKVIMGAVTNEDVITAYLKKVVATSLITVPKKLNFKTKHKQQVINEVQSITGINLEQKYEPAPKEDVEIQSFELTDDNNEPVSNEVETELVIDNSESSIEEPLLEETLEYLQENEMPNNAIEESPMETLDIETEVKVEEPLIEESVELLQEDENSNNFIEESPMETLDIETEVKGEEPLIEESVELLQEDENSNNFIEEYPMETLDIETEVKGEETLTEESVELLQEDEISNDYLEEPQFETFEIKTEVETAIEDIKESSKEDILQTETIATDEDGLFSEGSMQAELIENLEEELEPLSLESNSEIDVTLVDKMINGVTPEQEDIKDLENNTAEVESLDIDNCDTETDLLTIENVEELDSELVEKEFEPLEDNSELTESEIKLPCYDCFDYEPSEPVYNEEEICKALIEYNSKYSDKKIIEICNLKYKEKMPVPQIAETLNLQEEIVIETLNDIIEFVKDM